MSIRIDRRSGSTKLRWWFAGSSLLMVAAMVWLVWVDYDRPWRQYQDRYFDNRAALVHLRFLGQPEGQSDGRHPPADTTDDERHRARRPTSSEPGQVPAARRYVNLPLLDSIAPRSTPGKHRINQVVLPGIRQQLNYVETGTTERCTTCHAAIDDAAFAEAGLAATLETALPAVNDVLERLGHDRPGFPAPPAVKRDDGATFDVGRVTEHWDWLDDSQRKAYLETLLEVVNGYLQIHGGPQIRFEPPLRAHPNLDLYLSPDSPHPLSTTGCTVCHEGNPRETDFVLAAHSPTDRTKAKRWEAEHPVTRFGVPIWTFEQAARSWNNPMPPLQYAEAGCAKCHYRVTDVSGVGVGNHGTRLDRGRHLFKSLGCMNCHEITTIGRTRQVGPDLTRIAAKLPPQFIQDWVLEPQRFRPSTRMPHFFDQENNRAEAGDGLDPEPAARSAAEVAGILAYLLAVSDPVELHPAPVDVAPKVSWGRELFKSFGCLACHASVTEFGDSWIADDLAQRDEFNRIVARKRSEAMSFEEQVRYAMRWFPGEFEAIARTGGGRRHREDRDTPPALTRFAPELSAVGFKVSFEWLYSWIIEPAHYSAATKMPDLRLPPAEAAHIASYLATLDGGGAESVGTICDDACRRTVDQLLASLLSAQLSSEDLAAVLADRDERLTRMLMAQLADSPGEEQADRQIGSMDLAKKRLMLLGSRMISHYGCYVCHHIAGFEDTPRPGTELSRWGEKPIAQLDFASFGPGLEREPPADPRSSTHLYPLDADRLIHRSFVGNPEIHVSRSRASFANHKLLNPRIWDRQIRKPPYEKLKMPNFYLAQDEVDALVTYLLSNQPARVADELQVDYRDTPAGMIATGRDIVREYNCIACHEMDGNRVLIWQYLRPPDWEDRSFEIAPPSLRNEGARVQSEWLIRFLDDVQPIRPWLEPRMPSFRFTEEDRIALARYLVGLSQSQHQRLVRALQPIREYIANLPADDGAGLPWYEEDSLADATAQLRKYAVDNRIISPQVIDPANQGTEAYAAAHERILAKVEALENLHDVSYPVMESPDDEASPELIADGETIFLSLHCMSCHLFAETLPVGERILAPNLRPVHQRFRRDWLYEWLEKPHRIVQRTYMPDLFDDDLTSLIQRWSVEEHEQLRNLLHDGTLIDDGRAVMRAMTAFLFDAGEKCRTDVTFGSPVTRELEKASQLPRDEP